VRCQLISRGFDHVLLLEDLGRLETVFARRRVLSTNSDIAERIGKMTPSETV
jgi:hypothetical protein